MGDNEQDCAPKKDNSNVVSLEGRAKKTSKKDGDITTESEASVMVRGVDGRIALWNRGAQQSYGWSRRHAVGQVSHELLQTEFPSPLTEINQILMREKVWAGELIHSLHDGSRVRVLSRWELHSDVETKSPLVFEVNREFIPLDQMPKSANNDGVQGKIHNALAFMMRLKAWWLIPLFIVTAILVCLNEFAGPTDSAPPQ